MKRHCALAIRGDDVSELPECQQFLHLLHDLLVHPMGNEDTVASAQGSGLYAATMSGSGLLGARTIVHAFSRLRNRYVSVIARHGRGRPRP